MLAIVKVAVRNIGRNKRRTVITIVTVFLGVVVSTMTRGLLNGLQSEIRGNLTRKLHGDLQIHKRGYQDSLESNPYKLLIKETTDVKGVVAAPRLRIMGLVNHQKNQLTTPVMITGIDSEREALVCPRFAQSVQKGKMLDSTKEQTATQAIDDDLGEAHGLDSAVETESKSTPRAVGYHQILLTTSLQRGLGAEIGDEIVVLIADRYNMQQALVATFSGVIDVATPGAATRMAWMDLKSLQETLHIDHEVSELALRISEGDTPEKIRDALRPEIPEDQIIETWLELGGFLRDAMALQDLIFSAIVVIMFVIVVTAIVNTSLMTVMERTREIGTLMALGYRRKHILFLFLTEAAVIGGAGGLSGLAVASGLLGFLNWHGIKMALPGQTVITTLYPWVPAAFLGMALLLAISAALISGFLPAYRASRMKPVDALSSN